MNENHSYLRTQIILCTIGTALEWYDYSLFAAMTTILSQIFFPQTNYAAAQIATFGIFAAGFIMRPLGAIFFGHLGDKVGRKSTLLITIILMTIATTLLSFIPTTAIYSIYVLIACRLVQGFAASGEYGGGITLLYELADDNKGFVTSFGLFAAILGILLGSTTVAIVSSLVGSSNMIAWGWRIPFLLGLPLGMVGYILRKYLLESEKFKCELNKNKIYKLPSKKLLASYKMKLVVLLGMYTLGNISFYINFIYLSNYTVTKNADIYGINYISSFTTLLYAVSILTFGFLSDYFDRKRIMIMSCLLTIAFGYVMSHTNLHTSSRFI